MDQESCRVPGENAPVVGTPLMVVYCVQRRIQEVGVGHNVCHGPCKKRGLLSASQYAVVVRKARKWPFQQCLPACSLAAVAGCAGLRVSIDYGGRHRPSASGIRSSADDGQKGLNFPYNFAAASLAASAGSLCKSVSGFRAKRSSWRICVVLQALPRRHRECFEQTAQLLSLLFVPIPLHPPDFLRDKTARLSLADVDELQSTISLATCDQLP
ncbi:hypothetical protein VTN02DRAFT_4458 [Thermoascus thermophilus]